MRQRPFPPEWDAIIARNTPLAASLSENERQDLRKHILVLLDEKNWEGAGGLDLTDEIRVTIAAHAALLILNRDTDFYPTLFSIIVYPDSFWVPDDVRDEDGTVSEGFVENLGESWHEGAIVLSWKDVLREGRSATDGRNVCLHEFAHQLDRENGDVDGVPNLDSDEAYRRWAETFARAYDRHCDAVDGGRHTVIDPYGAEHPSEFFAVLVEAFFERPTVLKKKHVDLYALLAEYFRQDPAKRVERARVVL